MLLAINYSHQAAQLVTEGHLPLDRFKCPNWPDMIEEARQLCRVAVHFNLNAGQNKIRRHTTTADWNIVARLLAETDTPYVNLHLDPKAKYFPGIPVDTTNPQECAQVIDAMIEDVQVVARRFGAERVIVENVSYHGPSDNTLRPAVEPAAIRQVVETTNCGLLLDISHARIAAHSLGIDEREYMAQLPVERLRELHFTGLHKLNGRLQDHLEILESDWPALDWVLERIRSGEWAMPWLLAFEYGGVGEKFEWRSEARVIAEQVPKLYERVKNSISSEYNTSPAYPPP